jgi:hypothetical protein
MAKRKSKAQSQKISRQREVRSNAIEQMNPALKAAFRQIEDDFTQAQAGNILFYWRIGGVINEIRADTQKYHGRRNQPAMDLLEAAMPSRARMIRQWAQVAKKYTEEQVNTLTQINADGFALNWAHVRVLAVLSDAWPVHLQFAMQAAEKQWTSDELYKAIQRHQGVKLNAHGRGRVIPPTIAGQVSKLHKLTRTWIETYRALINNETNTFSGLINIPLDDVDSDLVTDVNELTEMLQNVIQDATNGYELLVERAIPTVNDKLQAKMQSQAQGGRARRQVIAD